jgi:hypothetical protein
MSESPVVNRFLRELDQALGGRRRWREDVLTEIEAHLLDALDRVGDDPGAARQIVEQFGDPRAIARGLNDVDARFRHGRRVVLAVGCSGAAAIAGAATVVAMGLISNGSTVTRGPARANPATLVGRLVSVDPMTGEVRLSLRG